MFKSSLYTYSCVNDQGDLLLYNFRTQCHLKIGRDFAPIVNEVLQRSVSDSESSCCFINDLLRGGFLVKCNFNEIKWCKMKNNEVIFGNDTLSLEILTTNMCNFRCTYCFEEHNDCSLTDDIENRIIKFLEKKIKKSNQVRIAWFGGEPLLNSESILRIGTEADRLCKKYGVPLYGEISTNGYLLTDELMRKLICIRITDYQVCIDGPEKQHNYARPHVDNNNSYSVIMENLRSIKNNIKSKAFRMIIRTNITPHLEPYIEEHLQMMAREFREDLKFLLMFQCVRDWGGDSITEDQIVDDEGSRYKKWYNRANELGLHTVNTTHVVPFVSRCPAHRRNGYVINSNGDILKCSLAMNSEYSEINRLGYINDDGREIIDQSKLSQWIISENTKVECESCVLYPYCMGGSCFFSMNIKHKDDNCNLYLLSSVREWLVELDNHRMITTLACEEQRIGS